MKTSVPRIATFVLFAALMVPHVQAADPRTNYNQFTPTPDRLNTELDSQCRSELNISADATPVGAQLFHLRRCVTRLVREVDRRREVEQSQTRRAVRLQAAQQRSSMLLRTHEARVQRAIKSKLQQRVSQVVETAEQRSQRMLELRTQRRVELNTSESNRSASFEDRRAAMRAIRTACNALLGDERTECVQMQIHNKNLYDM